MSQWGVQLVIGKLVTDGAFRQRFEARARESLLKLREQGIDLSEREIAAVLDTDPRLWSRVAKQIDSRLRPTRLSRLPETAAQKAPQSLTSRERQVLHGIFEGLTNKQIATDIGVSESAVKATLQHLFRKTQVRTRAQLVRIVFEGLFGVPQDGQ
jgi:DNA-binding NarL/FixJ family response regulator